MEWLGTVCRGMGVEGILVEEVWVGVALCRGYDHLAVSMDDGNVPPWWTLESFHGVRRHRGMEPRAIVFARIEASVTRRHRVSPRCLPS